MEYELRIIAEKVSVSSQEVVKRDTLKVYDIEAPESILDLGLRHEEQISLLEKVQNSLLALQSKLIDPGYYHCPRCGQKIVKKGFTKSKFHAVFTDHKIGIQKHKCKNPDCDWQSAPTTSSVFGTPIHPDLAKLQCEQGALYSFRKAQTNLEKLTVHRRSVNNHNQVKHITNEVGAKLTQAHLQPIATTKAASAQEVILQIDGGHVPTKDPEKRSFEALSAVAYRPENIIEVDSHHRQIKVKSCALSAQDDDLTTMKTYTLNAARKQGMTENTRVTALADGAQNCWSVVLSLAPHCKNLLCILDWFHIAMRFQNVRGAVDDAFTETLEGVKWKLWHGKSDEALQKLELLMTNITDEKRRSKLKKLYNYLENNQVYLVNYKERDQQGLCYTSQVAESHIDTIINDRFKRTKKMQWTHDGAHNVLQIRGMITSNEWEKGWQAPVLSALVGAA
ncbi:ISKra4 family transposase (plasmid) [Acaryochloris sp. 'Moss Beach']|uniref:ISKra4 family transposase n=1 Tax=Acaryochloris sp. 'Moss Beach' TaxID=2740837 RepID=UPI001F270CC2|nr:ISKra4 family transposase [Acaryochloris sp. 'Moss Beach']UJB73061.1 ISKra4 family transposase [Acaryochloris sp. 'Moss Beach']